MIKKITTRIEGAPERVYIAYYKKTGIRITGNPIKNNSNPALMRETRILYSMVQNSPQKALPKVEELVGQYPDVPLLKNYLYICYAQIGQMKKANEILDLTIEQHPDYIFGITNKFSNLENEEEIKKYGYLLGEPRDIRTLLPNRKKYHITEFVNYQLAAVQYEAVIGELDSATFRLDDLIELGEDNMEIDRLTHYIGLRRIEEHTKKIEESEKILKKVKSFPKVKYTSTNQAPILQHSELQFFYQKSEKNISYKKVKELFDKHGQALIPDLEAILEDSIRRYDYFGKIELHENTHSFPIHTLYFLGALKAETSLQKVLDTLRMGEKFCEFWFGFDAEFFYLHMLYFLGQNQLTALKDFVLEDNTYCWNKNIVISSIEQIAHHQPDRREDVIEWLEEVMTHFLNHSKNKKLIDTFVISHLAEMAVNLRAIELLPIIEKFFEKKWIDKYYKGDLKMHETDIQKDLDESNLEPMPLDIEEFYTKEYRKRAIKRNISSEEADKVKKLLNSPSRNSLMDMFMPLLEKNTEKVFDSQTKGKLKLLSKKKDDASTPPKLITFPQPKISRNAPCPCGSGKKYKRCCLN
ncbi:MAG: SEC-C metal-binding domain-containing protein [Chitinophagales bacterium]